MTRDLTEGRPESVLWLFCLPLFGSVIFQQLYNIADSLVAGKFIDANALAAVGNSYEITLIFIAFAFGCNIGCSVCTSQFFGAKDYRSMKTTVYTSLISTGVLVAVLMLLGLLGGNWMLKLIRTPEEIMAGSQLYLRIYVLGLPFMFFYNVANGIFSALGDSRTPFLFLAASSVSNIVVDILFVAVLDMGIAGVAWATFLCQGVSAVLAIVVVLRRFFAIRTDGDVALFSLPILGKILKIAIPSTLQQSFVSVGNIIIQSIINGFGASVIAGYSAAIKLNNLVITSFTTLGNGISNYTAQNLGAGKKDRIRQGFRAGIKMVWSLCIPMAALYFFGCRYLLYMFLDESAPAAISTGMILLRILAPFYFVISTKLVADGILRGSGIMNLFMISTFTDLLLRVSLAAILSRSMGSVGIWSAWPVGWSIATGMSILFYYSKSEKKKGRIAK